MLTARLVLLLNTDQFSIGHREDRTTLHDGDIIHTFTIARADHSGFGETMEIMCRNFQAKELCRAFGIISAGLNCAENPKGD